MRDRLALAILLALLGLGVLAGSALAYEFNEPSVKQIGPEEVVFDARNDEGSDHGPECGRPASQPVLPGCLKDACDGDEIPDVAARAIRRGTTETVIFASHYVTRRFVAPGTGSAAFNVDNITHPCDEIVLSPAGNSNPAAFHDKEWLSSPYALDQSGTNIVALIHEEYQGWNWPTVTSSFCNQDFDDPPNGITFQDHQKCWRNSITLAKSTDGGRNFFAECGFTPEECRPVASPPFKYQPEAGPGERGPFGYFKPSNIVLHTDGLYYALIRSTGNLNRNPNKHDGVCVMRTTAAGLADPTSWEAWGDGPDGGSARSFEIKFVNPYDPAYDPVADPPANHLCQPVDNSLGTISSTLVFSTYLNAYVAIDVVAGSQTPGVYYSTSPDLLDWSPQKLLMKAEVPPLSPVDCVPPHPVRVPSLIDHSNASQNYERIGKTPYLYFTRSTMYANPGGGCTLTNNRDLVRIKIEFDNSTPTTPPPTGGGGGSTTPPPASGSGGKDTKAATLALTAGKKQDIDKLTITVRLDESATVEGTATVNVPGASRVYNFKRTRRSVTANKSVKLKLKLSPSSLKKVKRALRRGKKLTARAKVTATDGAGNKTVRRRSIKLKP